LTSLTALPTRGASSLRTSHPGSPNRLQTTTDRDSASVEAIGKASGNKVDYAMLVKDYGTDASETRRFSPQSLAASP
jgi:hypothetical protein